VTGSLYQHNSSPLHLAASVPQWIREDAHAYEVGQTMSPAPSERRPAPRPFPSQSVSGQKPQTWNRGRRHFYSGSWHSCAFFDMIWSKRLYRATCASQVLDLTACGHPSGLPTRQQRTPHLQAGLGQKRCQEGARRHVTPRGVVTIGCGHLQLGFLPPSSSGMLCSHYRAQKDRIPDHLPSCECSICRGSLRGLGPCAPTH
jgi:hypothetical protein